MISVYRNNSSIKMYAYINWLVAHDKPHPLSEKPDPGAPDTTPESIEWEDYLPNEEPQYEPGDKDAENDLQADPWRWD